MKVYEDWKEEALVLKEKEGFLNGIKYCLVRLISYITLVFTFIFAGLILIVGIGGAIAGFLIIPLELNWSVGVTIAVVCIILALIVIRG